MTDLLSFTVTVVALLAGLAGLVAWVRKDTFSGTPVPPYNDLYLYPESSGTTVPDVPAQYRSPAIARFVAGGLSGS